MKKKVIRRLALKKMTITALSPSEQNQVDGGVGSSLCTSALSACLCPETYTLRGYSNCTGGGSGGGTGAGGGGWISGYPVRCVIV